MKLRLIDPPTWLEEPRMVQDGEFRRGVRRNYEVGDCWYATKGPGGVWYMYPDGKDTNDVLNRSALCIATEHRGKTPMIVVLPVSCGHPFCLHSPTVSHHGWGSSGWHVEGELPDVTVKPSINYGAGTKRSWHGFITNGEMR